MHEMGNPFIMELGDAEQLIQVELKAKQGRKLWGREDRISRKQQNFQ